MVKNSFLVLFYFAVLSIFFFGSEGDWWGVVIYMPALLNIFTIVFFSINWENVVEPLQIKRSDKIMKLLGTFLNNVFPSNTYHVLTFLFTLIFIGVFFSIDLKVLAVIFAFSWLQMFITFYLAVFINSKMYFGYLRDLILILFASQLILSSFSVELITLNPLVLLIVSPVWVFEFNALLYVSLGIISSTAFLILVTFFKEQCLTSSRQVA